MISHYRETEFINNTVISEYNSGVFQLQLQLTG